MGKPTRLERCRASLLGLAIGDALGAPLEGLSAQQIRSHYGQVADYVELPSAAACCGAAGTYAMLRPRDSAAVLDPKLDEIAAADVDYVVAVNPGCLRQLRAGLRRRGLSTRAVHLAELLAGRA
jgi:Fe-S oxidoreductase